MRDFRPRLLPTIFLVPTLLLEWKEGLIAERRAATSAAPVPLPQSLQQARGMEFRHVFADGVFLNNKEIYLYAAPHAGEIGFDVLTPLARANGDVVFVNRGFVPAGLRDPAKRAARGQTELVRAQQRSPPQPLVLGRSAGDGRRRRAQAGGAVLCRCRCDAEPRRLAAGRLDPRQPAEPSPAIRADLVFLGGGVACDLCPLSPQHGSAMTAYQRLEAQFRRLGLLEEAISLLQWDAATIMPGGGASGRAEQLAALRLFAHELLTAPEIPDLLAAAEAEMAALDPWRQANLREMRRRWWHQAAVPGALVAARSRACSECEMRWRRARAADDFPALLPAFERVLRLTREVAAAKAAALDLSPYEALVDQYEPGLDVATIDRVFADLVRF